MIEPHSIKHDPHSDDTSSQEDLSSSQPKSLPKPIPQDNSSSNDSGLQSITKILQPNHPIKLVIIISLPDKPGPIII